MSLSNLTVEHAKPKEKPQKLFDGGGLYLYVPAKSSSPESQGKRGRPRQYRKSWRFDYRYGSKRCTLTLGTYPILGLADAREKHRQAQTLLANGENPALAKRVQSIATKQKINDTFGAIAEAWFHSKTHLRSKAWNDANRLYLKRDLFPILQGIPINQIDRALVLSILESCKQTRGVRTAERVRQTAVQVFDFAIRKIKCDINPAAMLKSWDEMPPVKNYQPLKESEIHIFFERLDRYPGLLVTKLFIKLLALFFVRKNELIPAHWEEFDIPNAKWHVPASRMKMKRHHVVPLSLQSIRTLEQLKSITTGSPYLFPSFCDLEKPMSGSTINSSFVKMGYAGTFTPHGLRATASTWLNGQGYRSDVIERQLAHVERNQIRAAYNHADYLPERIELMQAWADFIDPMSGD